MSAGVAVAISAFRSDDAVLPLLQAVFAQPHPEVGQVIVVDSFGSGAIPRAAADHGWPVVYENADRNLGSAGNLARRMQLATDAGFDWCYCLNHDASWSAERLREMLAVARSRPRVGAVYPVLHHGRRPRPWEDGRRSFTPSAGNRLAHPPEGQQGAEVLWSSSNGALYATAPLREGVEVMVGLWMGYEDLAYGVALARAGWSQLMCRKAVLSDVFDYGRRRILGRDLYIPEKPVWYAYYNIRNLLLIRRKYGADGISKAAIIRKTLQSAARIALLENQKTARLGMLLGGAVAGCRGVSGKGPAP